MSDLFNLGDLVDRAGDPAKPALIDLGAPGGARRYSHGDLDAAIQALARGLLARGFRRGDHIAILAANSVEFLIAYLGTMRAGIVSIPVNHKFPRETIAFILADADCKLVFTDAERREMVPAGYDVVMFRDDGPAGFDALLAPGAFQTVVPDDGEVAMFLYTSGSTGRPKGVPLTHAGHLWVVAMRIKRRPDPDHRLLVAAPLYHMNGLAICKVALAAHLTVVLLPRFTATDYIRAIGAHGVTWLTSVAAMMAMVVREGDLLRQTDLSTVRIVRMGSAPVSQKLIADIRTFLPNAAITNGYGTTEAGPVVYGPHPDGLKQPDISIGYPIEGIARLVDGDDLDADNGELHCRNPAVTPGYHNLLEKTAESMTEDGWYRTGDVMRRDADGFHYFVGRVDDMFNCGGENIYPSEVEKLLERHEAIEQACVVPVPDDIKGFKPVAFVVATPGATVTEAVIKSYALANGPAYQHPRSVSFLDSLPLTGTNKVDRKMLTARAEESANR
jgi:acyl-CoA synthetase (AMP-forming)/AMP-acid ligase II